MKKNGVYSILIAFLVATCQRYCDQLSPCVADKRTAHAKISNFSRVLTLPRIS